MLSFRFSYDLLPVICTSRSSNCKCTPANASPNAPYARFTEPPISKAFIQILTQSAPFICNPSPPILNAHQVGPSLVLRVLACWKQSRSPLECSIKPFPFEYSITCSHSNAQPHALPQTCPLVCSPRAILSVLHFKCASSVSANQTFFTCSPVPASGIFFLLYPTNLFLNAPPDPLHSILHYQ